MDYIDLKKANKNYVTGRRLEYKIINLLKLHLDKDKYTVIRTAGSHSPVDVYVIEHRTKQGFGIQCKSTKKKTYSMKPIEYSTEPKDKLIITDTRDGF